MATTVPGGRYIVGGKVVNAEGEPIVEAEIVEQPAEDKPADEQPDPVVEGEPEAEQPAEDKPAKAKRSKK